ncbi:hypothetical protein GCM10022631_27600 [Deinococcus rubellus]
MAAYKKSMFAALTARRERTLMRTPLLNPSGRLLSKAEEGKREFRFPLRPFKGNGTRRREGWGL